MLSRQPPTNPVQDSVSVAQEEAAFPDWKLVHHGRNPTMLAGAADVAVITSQVVLVHGVPGYLSGKVEPGHDSLSARLRAQVQVDWKVRPWEYFAN